MPLVFNPFTGNLDDAGQSKTGQVIIRAADQLAGTLRSDVVYFIDAQIDLALVSVEIPAGGLTFDGHGYDISQMYSSDPGATIFTSPGGGSGNLNIANVTLWVDGAGSKIFDIDNLENNGAVELNTVNLGAFGTDTTEIGEIANYRQFRASGCAVINVLDGLTFTGAWSGGFSIRDSILLAIGAGVSVFKAGFGLVFAGSSISDLNALSIDDTVIVFDFAPANFDADEGFQLNGARFNLDSDPVPNMTEASTKRFFKNCTGVKNTYGGGRWVMATGTTTNLSVGTPAKLAGTTIYDSLVYFESAGNNAFRYLSTIPKDFRITGFLTVDGGPNDDLTVTIRQWDNSAGAYIDIADFTKNISNVIGGLDVADFVLLANADLAENDRIELWITNEDDGSDASATGYLMIDVRL